MKNLVYNLFSLPLQKRLLPVFLLASLFINYNSSAQLGVYTFTGTASCPSLSTSVTTQPANAVFSAFSTVNTTCVSNASAFVNSNWNTTTLINLTEYNQFTITPNSGYYLTLTSLSFTQVTNANNTTTWALRSSIDNYAANIATGTATTTIQTPSIPLPSASFTNIGAVTFRLYLIRANANATTWSVDNVTLNGSTVAIPADPANPTSNSPQCSPPGVTLTSSGIPPAGETWYWQISATGTSTANSALSLIHI